MGTKQKVARVFNRAWNGFSGVGSWAKASKKAGSRAHRAPDKVTPGAKRVANIARNQFGVSLPALETIARKADPERMKIILAMGESGENQKLMAPLIAQSITNKIEGVAAINKMNADIIGATARGAIDIKRSMNQASLTNTRYGNQIRETNLQHRYNTEAEERRHTHSNQTVIMNAYVREHLDKTKQMQSLKQTVLDVQKSQIDADRDYKQKQLALLASQGSHADFSNIARAEYNFATPERKMNVLPQQAPKGITRAVRGLMNYIKGNDL